MLNPRLQTVSAPRKPKAGTFGALSACAARRVPSHVSRRFSITHPTCEADRTSDPWVAGTPRRGSQARLERISRTRVRSTRISTPPCLAQNPFGLSISTSVPQNSGAKTTPARFKPHLLYPLPAVSTLARPPPPQSRRHSLLDRARRMPSPSRYPPLHVHASVNKYTLDIALPAAIKPEMVTITTAKGDILKIVADAWHLESDCHFEWEVVFPHDVDASTIRAKFDVQGQLNVSAGRRSAC